MKKPLKILICTAQGGNGHKAVSQALEQEIHKNYREKFTVKTLDIFYEAGVSPYKDTDLIHTIVSRWRFAEMIFNFTYNLLLTELGNLIHNELMLPRVYKKTKKIVEQEDPDIIISIHWLPCPVLERLYYERPQTKYVVVNTDLVSSVRSYLQKNADLIVLGTTNYAKEALEMGIPESNLMYPYYPVRPQLSEFKPKLETTKELGLDPDKPILLMSSGGVGGLKLREEISELVTKTDFQMIVICGKLDYLREDLERIYRDEPRVKIMGFVDNMQDYLHACDLYVGKPGSVSMQENLVFGNKVILTEPIGKQELVNIDFALKNPNFRYIGSKTSKLVPTAIELMSSLPTSQDKKILNLPDYNRRFSEVTEIMSAISNLVDSSYNYS